MTFNEFYRTASMAEGASITLREKFDRLIDVGVSQATRSDFLQFMAEGKFNEATEFIRNALQNFPVIDRIVIASPEGIKLGAIPTDPTLIRFSEILKKLFVMSILKPGSPETNSPFWLSPRALCGDMPSWIICRKM